MQNTTLFIIPGACSFGAIVALDIIGKPYTIGITTPEIRKSEVFLKVNPLGKVGALLDDGAVIYENLAILLYLIDKNPNSKIAIPVGTQDRIEVYKWLSYLSSTLHVGFGPLFNPSGFVDESAIDSLKEHAVKKLKNILAYMDNYFTQKPYLIKAIPTVVDAQAYGLLRWTRKFGLLEEFFNIQKFLSRMEELEAVQNALNIEQNKPESIKNSSFNGYYNFA